MNGEFRRDCTQGEFRGDFTRDTFTPKEHFIRVLSQQGRVWLDADWNEQTSILLHYIQTLAKDIIGNYGGWDEGFKIEPLSTCENDFSIHEGHYYVDGILCENDRPICYSGQKDYHLEEPLSTLLSSNNTSSFLVYLDVWERYVSYIQDMDNKYRSIREVALGGPDTAGRSKLVWQVKVKPLGVPPLDLDNFNLEKCSNNTDCCQEIEEKWKDIVLCLQPENRGWLVAEAKFVDEPKSPCSISPEARFTGEGNYLYRVEIHRGGYALKSGKGNAEEMPATFKWSRSNGSVEFPLSANIGAPAVKDGKESILVNLEHLRCCDSPCLSEDDWVEIVDDDYVLLNKNEPLWQVKSINSLKWEVTLERDKWENQSIVGSDLTKHPLLRRWDQKEGEIKEDDPYIDGKLSEGTVVIVESEVESDNGNKKAIWIQLEKGIKVMFLKNNGNDGGANEYRTGDYWLITARAATGDIEWPKMDVENDTVKPCALGPHGIDHHYAPLAVISFASNNMSKSIANANIFRCRKIYQKVFNLEH